MMKPILHSFGYAIDFLCDQVSLVTASEMVVQPSGIPNHPAWVIGHLTFTLQMLGGTIGLAEWLPADWAKRYGTGSVPVGEFDLYESKDDALRMLRDAQARITAAVEGLDASALDAEFPDPAYHHVFPTIRHALTQVLVGHTAFHVGQISVWRKAMGLPAMQQSFE